VKACREGSGKEVVGVFKTTPRQDFGWGCHSWDFLGCRV